MEQTLQKNGSAISGTSNRNKNKQKTKKQATPYVLQILAMLAIAALVYPTAADWVSRIGHNKELSGYVQTVESIPAEERAEKLETAYQYNRDLPPTVLQDPYGAANDEDLLENTDAYKSYKEVLNVSDNGVIGEIIYPKLKINLPIYHGTGDKAISTGAGHLYGSSLPVGGPSTHAVLTAHSGLVNASLFTPLPKAKKGDTFKINVLGETKYYEVYDLETIEPFVTDSLSVQVGEDLVTLITCTPIGINSHRLLVHAKNIPAPETDNEGNLIAGDGKGLGFPWWAVIFIGGSALVSMILFKKPKTAKTGRYAERKNQANRTHREHN